MRADGRVALSAPRVVEVRPDGEALAVELGEPGVEARPGARDGRVDPPPGRGAERDALALALDDEADRDGLDAARGARAGEDAPEHLGDVEAHEAVEDAARLLGVDEVVVDVARLGQRVLDRLGGDLVEDHPADGHGRAEHLDEVPGDRLALAVLVGGEQQLVGGLERVLQGSDLGGVGDHVDGLEVVLRVDAERAAHLGVDDVLRQLGRRVRQVPDVAARRQHGVARRPASLGSAAPWPATRR